MADNLKDLFKKLDESLAVLKKGQREIREELESIKDAVEELESDD